jgi:NADPH-dependent 2,4-dienoyl-CoA reductase/sulfur reductase-like enzyme
VSLRLRDDRVSQDRRGSEYGRAVIPTGSPLDAELDCDTDFAPDLAALVRERFGARGHARISSGPRARMSSEKTQHAVILGNGVAGYTAALKLRELRPSWRITMISGESTYPFSRPALMYVYLGHMRYQDTKPFEDRVWSEQRIDLVRDWVTRIDTGSKQLTFSDRPPMPYDRLLLATGSRPNKFGWPGQDLDGVQGLYSLADLKSLYDVTPRVRRAVIVGGGLIGVELAEMLHSRAVHVTFLVREKSYWGHILPAEESAMVNRQIAAAGMQVHYQTELKEIVGQGAGRVEAVVTKQGERIACEFVGLTAGVSPNVDVAKASTIPVARGVLVDATLKSRVDDVWAAGDCAEIVGKEGQKPLLQQVWYTGKMQGEVAALGMAGTPRTYDPGIWFNSAKFLDLEYQTYGRVNMRVDGERSVYWERADGAAALRIVYTDAGVIGVNAMGLRIRHEVCERWIRESLPIHGVLARLGEANFDPEFFARHEPEIASAFARQALSPVAS